MLSLQRGWFSASAVWWTCFTAPLSVQLTSGHAELCSFCFPPGRYSTRRLETLHHIHFHSTLTRYLARPRSVFFFVCVAGDGCCRCCSDALWWEAPQSQSWYLNQSSQRGKKNTKTCILDMWSSGAAPVYEFNLLDKRLVWTFWKVGNKMRQDSSFPFWHKQAGTGYSNFWATYNNNLMSFVCVLLHF